MWFLRFPKVFVENLLRKAMLKSLSFKMSLSNGIVVLCFKENEPTSWSQEFVLLKFGDVFFKVAYVSWFVKYKASGHRQISFFFLYHSQFIEQISWRKNQSLPFFHFFRDYLPSNLLWYYYMKWYMSNYYECPWNYSLTLHTTKTVISKLWMKLKEFSGSDMFFNFITTTKSTMNRFEKQQELLVHWFERHR